MSKQSLEGLSFEFLRDKTLKSVNPIKDQLTKTEKKIEETQTSSSSSSTQCGLNSNLCLGVYQQKAIEGKIKLQN